MKDGQQSLAGGSSAAGEEDFYLEKWFCEIKLWNE